MDAGDDAGGRMRWEGWGRASYTQMSLNKVRRDKDWKSEDDEAFSE